MTTDLGTWLRAQREERGWSRSEMGRRLIAAARETGDAALPDAETVRGYIYRWEHGKTRALSERYVLYYCRALAIKPAQFGPRPQQPEPAPGPAVTRPAAVLPAGDGMPYCQHVAYRGMETPNIGQSTVRQEVLMAAHEGSDHAARAEEHGIGDATLEQLRADLVRLAHESDTGQPFTVFLDLRRVRDRVYQLLDRRLWPGEQADLYFILGVINGLMGITADRLGYPDSGEELIRSGWAYATAIDHRPLLATLRLQLSTVAFWRGMTVRSRDLAADGLRYLAAGPTAADLHLKLARAAAVLGDADSARQAITDAHEARAREHTDELLELGGEFSVSLATHHYFAGAALSELSEAQTDATTEIKRAVTLYEAGPGPGEEHYFGTRALASIDLAAVRLRTGALDAATAAMTPVLSLPPAQRVSSLRTRMHLVRAELAAPVFRGSAQARELDERIEEFGRDSVTAGLHALPAGPA
ncbi:MAG TPA: helix-turn-helix transcriptional regulator [Trebonia sp.]|nr:helix-turn-helix transcriptional regulator [Trebonia sp.]